jgi:universal protein Kae1
MKVLGIESTAHTFGIGIIDSKSKKVLANVRASFQSDDSGMIPAQVADFHVKNFHDIIKKALNSAALDYRDIDLVAFSMGPGIGHSLRIGAITARSLALLLKIPLIGVNHSIAHLEIGRLLFNIQDPLLLYASGANTQIIAYEGKRYRIFGETLDIGIGNFIDNVARLFNLGFPGGPKIEDLASKGKNYIKLPYTVKGMDLSFGGLITNIKQKLHRGYRHEDLAYSIQETIFSMLIEITERALAHAEKKELLLGGGVACNKRLQEMAKIMAKQRNVRVFIPDNEFLVDNGAMIAWLGYLEHKSGKITEISKSTINPYERVDEVEIFFRK